LIAITVAFFGYKWFVFRTKGHYLREWLRCIIVYSGTIVFSAIALAPLVGLIRHTSRYQTQAPYIAGAVVAVFTVISSFFGHKYLSFRQTAPASKGPEPIAQASSSPDAVWPVAKD
jgi:putative flippase GtrA